MNSQSSSEPRRRPKTATRTPRLDFFRQRESLGAEQDLEYGLQLLARTREEGTQPLVRVYQPQPTVSFGQRDRREPGFLNAVEASKEWGFTPVIRRAGGRAAAYHLGSLVVDHIEPDTNPIRESQSRFVAFGELFVDALRRCGVDANMGPLPYEYCPGEHSVHGVNRSEPDRRVKIIGTAQRQIATGWLFSSSIVIADPSPIRGVLTSVYEALGIDWDPLTAGAISDVEPGVTVAEVEAALRETYAEHWQLRDVSSDHISEREGATAEA